MPKKQYDPSQYPDELREKFAPDVVGRKYMPEPVKRRILLAEDDDSMRRYIEVILEQAGYEVLAAEDGLVAMSMAFETDIDAVVADALMPNFSGYELCRMLRNDPAKCNIPLIIVSGFERQDDKRPETHLADLFLTKDARLKENLLSGIESLLYPADAA